MLTIIVRIFISAIIMCIALYAGLLNDKVPISSILFQIVLIAWLLSGPLCAWVLGLVDALDPISLLSLFGIHYFIFGPIYQLSLGYWPFLPWSYNVESYVPVWYWWQAAMLLFTFVATKVFSSYLDKPKNYTCISVVAFAEFPFILVILTFIIKAGSVIMLGGLSGMAAAYQARIDGGGVSVNNTFAGLGVVIALGNAFPIALGYWIIYKLKDNIWTSSRTFLSVFSIIIFCITFVLNGLMGSRANVIYAVVIVLGFYHLLIRPFKPMQIIFAVFLLFSFSQLYYAFKFGGVGGLLSGQTSSQILKERQIDNLNDFAIIRDYTRMDVQTLAIYAVENAAIEHSWGRSYLGGLAAIVPSAIWSSRIDSFTQEKSKIIYGRGNPGKITNLVFGGFGEAYVNFGILSALFCPLLGAAFSFMRRSVFVVRSGIDQHPVFTAPLLAILPIMLLIYDSNSLLYVLISVGVIPFLYGASGKRIKVFVDEE